jgi:hypothetical protein
MVTATPYRRAATTRNGLGTSASRLRQALPRNLNDDLRRP